MTNFFDRLDAVTLPHVFRFLYYRFLYLYEAEHCRRYYTCTHRRRAYCCLAGFDPNIKALSPGTLLIAHTIDSTLAEGAKRWIFCAAVGVQISGVPRIIRLTDEVFLRET